MIQFHKLKPEIKRYLIIGVSVYIFELIVIAVALNFGTNGVVAVGISFWLGLLVSFVLQKLVTFGDKRLHHRVLIPQLIAFSLLVIFNFSFTVLFTKITSSLMTAFFSRTFALGITTIWNFYLYRTKIFRLNGNL